MKDSCDAPYHNFTVVNWRITGSSRQARELLCNNCLIIVDLDKIRVARCCHDQAEAEAEARRCAESVILPEAPELKD